jgi:hypothetical protein
MTEATTNQTNTMRELLARWAELEPERCKHIKTGLQANRVEWEEFYISDGDQELLTHSDMHNISCTSNGALMWIQWAVQQAIVARGWYFQVRYVPINKKFLASVGFTYDQIGDNPAEAILSAYLKEIEAQSNQ